MTEEQLFRENEQLRKKVGRLKAALDQKAAEKSPDKVSGKIPLIDGPLKTLFEVTAEVTGDAFYKAMTQHLALALQVDYAMVTEYISERKSCKVLACWSRDHFLDNYEYLIAGTPCEVVLSTGNPVLYSEGVQEAFPLDTDLIDMEAKSFVGVPIFNRHKQLLGHIALLDRQPVEEVSNWRPVLEIFARRMGAELEAKVIARALAHSEQRRADLLSHVPIGLLEFDVSQLSQHILTLGVNSEKALGEYVIKNPAFFSNLGELVKIPYMNQQALDIFEIDTPGQLTENLPRFLTADFIGQLQELWMNWQPGQFHFDLESWLQTLGGKRKRLFMRYSILARQINHRGSGIGTISQVFCSIMDFSNSYSAQEQLKQQSQMLKGFMDHLPVIAFRMDRKGYFKEVMSSGQQALVRPEELLEKCLFDLFPIEPELLERALSGESVRVQLNGMDDDRAWHYQAVITADSLSSKGVIGFAIDITEQKQLEKQLRQAQKMETVGRLAGGIAHDLNNILSPIFGYTQIAMNALQSDSMVRGYLADVLKAAQRARDLVTQILSFSHRGEQSLKSVKIATIVDEVIKILKSTLPANIDIKEAIDNQTGYVLADPTQIHQVLLNLSTNAYHAMRKTGGTLTIKLAAVKAGKAFKKIYPDMLGERYLHISVADTGHGMTPEVADLVFEPFFTTKAKGEGTGLGLSVVHNIITGHKGKISVKSAPQKGTTFDIYLPLAEGPVEKITASKHSPIAGGRERLLYVDDEIAICNLVKSALEGWGYDVRIAGNGAEGLLAFKKALKDPGSGFDLVITDQTMPKMTGLELADEILKIKPGFPIIMVTGYSELATPEIARLRGLREYLMKPVLPIDLVRVVRRILDES